MGEIVQFTAADIYRGQRTEKGLNYDRKRASLREKLLAKDPQALALAKACAQDICQGAEFRDGMWHYRSVQPSSVHSSAFLTNLSVQYANDEYIGERLCPVIPVDKRSDDFATYGKRDRLGQYDDSIGPGGDVLEVEESRGSDNYSVKDRALQNYLAAETVENQDAVFDEMLDLTESVADNLALNREIRIATLLTSSGSYASGHVTTLSGSDQWNSAGGGDPIKNIQTAIATLWQGKGPTDLLGACSLDVFNALVRHPKLLDVFKYTRDGLITRQQLASLFGLTDLLVGAARKDTANKGQSASYSRIWGNHFVIARVARRPSRRSAHFASTFQLRQDPQTTTWIDPKKGKAGAFYLKIGLSDDHKIVANDTGFLLKDVIS